MALFDALGNRVTGVRFDASTTGFTFDNAAGLGSRTTTLPAITTLSVRGVHGALRRGRRDGLARHDPGRHDASRS